MNKVDEKRYKEQKIVQKMIEIYCKKKHKKDSLCESCNDLLQYTIKRSERCPFIETKTFCKSCKVHCYNEEMRHKIKEVMKFSGKYLLFYSPKEVFLHIIDSIRYKMKGNK